MGPLRLRGEDGYLTGLFMEDQAHGPLAEATSSWREDRRAFDKVVDQLDAYFRGELTEFDVPLRLAGTDFQRSVWAALQAIPFGRTASYGEIATAIERPKACRAVGLANGRNPVAIIVPCHRVIGASGALTGYGGGLDRKRWLLQHEQGRES